MHTSTDPGAMLMGDKKRVAIVGGGISGLAAAHLLEGKAHVTVFEAEPRLGGHARTVVAGKRGDQPVDTGFIVFNRQNYPLLTRLFEMLDVEVVKSNMSFGASIDGGRLEYALRDLGSVFAQPRNAFNPRFLRMLRDILRFNSRALALANDPHMTLGALLDRLGTGPWFRDYYILPLSGAIWSTPVAGIMDFPAQALVQFFHNHALMQASGQHQWYTVSGGSVEYVRKLQAHLVKTGVDLRLKAPVLSVWREGRRVGLRPEGGAEEWFDEVIFACHSDQALALLVDPSPEERAALGAVRYQSNEIVLHSDTTIMPIRRNVWSSWVYTEAKGQRSDKIDLTYWMNSLQPIPKDDPLFVTLNSNRPIQPELIHDVVSFAHPVYDLAGAEGRAQISAMNGRRNTWYCGAWMRNGFHEDGFASALDVVQGMDARQRLRAAA